MILLRTNGKFRKKVQDQELWLARRQVFKKISLSLWPSSRVSRTIKQRNQMDVIVADCLRQKPDGLHFSVVLSIRQRFQLCSRTRGTSVGLRTSKQQLRRCHGYLVCERILRPLQLRVSSGAMHLLTASIQLELLGCLQNLLREDNKSHKHCHDLQIPAT